MTLKTLVLRELTKHRPRPVTRAKEEVRRHLPTPRQLTRKAVDELDERVGLAKGGRKFLDHMFPDHWSFFLGELAMYSFVVLILSGIFLTLYYVPSEHEIVYHGLVKTLDGQKMSEAYRSVLNISFGVRFGLVVRQVHHWAAEIFIGAIVVHCCRIFFTSAYRRPRELNWCIGVTMLWLAIANGYMGYSILDDLLSGSGVRIGYGICESIPFVGSYLATFLWGGQFPGHVWIHRFFIAHVLIVPLLIMGLLGLHLLLIFRQEHTQWPGKGRTEQNVVGDPLWPMFTAKTTGLFLMVAGGLTLLGGIVQIEPVWTYGPYVPYKVSYAAQPDWYITWLEGALRVAPNWEWSNWGHTVPWMIFGAVVVFPTVTFLALYAWPWLEGWFMRDQVTHELLVAPRHRPIHTAIGAGFFTVYFVLLVASGDDVIANFFRISLNDTVWAFRVALVALPPIVAAIAYRVCKDLQEVPERRRLRRPARVRLSKDGAYVAAIEEFQPDGELPPLPLPDAVLEPVDGE